MTPNVKQVLGMVKGFLAGEEDARKVLADVFEDARDGETADLLRGERGIQWMTFDDDNAGGKVGVSRGASGPTIHLAHAEDTNPPQEGGVGYVDLFGASDEAPPEGSESPPPVSLTFFDLRVEEAAVRLVYGPDGSLEVIVNNRMEPRHEGNQPGIWSDGNNVYRFPASLTDSETDFRWTHLFPGDEIRPVILTVIGGIEDVDAAVSSARYVWGEAVTGDDLADLLDSLRTDLCLNGQAAGESVESALRRMGYERA